ncbi:hypothetical protein PpBr36_07175 [Pyricularia pennisetigena]|uniref:hypothetical protein n=1 Tax=Pyricularia pennisetigena TaxID=1578925 RepID=UPI00114E0FE1|nr:hypothetical protein PpBr36_07175 [Pyricularia pennisetigena]TLS25357.1 hypothetical protein PpBr36_07175 [Pyricularia pennisetigena]
MSSAVINVRRFLLPRGTRPLRRVPHHGTSLRSGLNSSAVSETPAHVRFGSTIKPPTAAKPQQQQEPPRHTVLEKPEKFNPPSHGARLPKKGYAPPRTYGGDLSAEQIKIQNTKDYPGMPPPQGSMAHRIIHNRRLHAFISIGVLTMLAIYTYVLNFRMNSPYVDMIPPWSDFFWHPFSSIYTVFDAVRLTTLHNSAIVAAKREKAIDDVLKRRKYRKAHGIDESEGVAGWFKADPVDPEEQEAAVAPNTASTGQQKAVEASSSEEKKDNESRKKILDFKASKTSSATPPFSSTFCTIAFMTANFVPPLGGFQTPSTASVSVFRASVCFCGAKVGAAIVLVAAVSTTVSSAAPEGVNLDGGSMTRMESRRKFRAPMLEGFTAPESTSISSGEFAVVDAASVIEMAMATSATASSSLDGSNMMLSPTAVTRSVIGGRDVAALSAVFSREYRNGETSQSSSKRGSSSPSDLRRGSRVASRARCVVRDSKGSG